MPLAQVAQYGVAIFSIGALVYVVHIFVKFLKNHIEHSTRASQRLADLIEAMLHLWRERD